MAGMSLIVRTISRGLFPFTFLFGAYIVLHGHLTPGGGFPGGVIMAAAIVMLVLAYGVERAQRKVRFVSAEVLESIGGLVVVAIGLLGIFLGVAFLENVLPLGGLGDLFSAGNLPLLYLGVGIKVAAGITLIFFAMLFAAGGGEE